MTTDDWLEPTGYFTVHELAYLHGTTEADVVRVVVEVLGLPPKDRFESQEFLKVNRILRPVPEPHEIPALVNLATDETPPSNLPISLTNCIHPCI